MPPQTNTVTVVSEKLNRQIHTLRPSVETINHHQHDPIEEVDPVELKSLSKKNSKLNRILKNYASPFLYIPDSDFSLVWQNIIFFAIAHIVVVYYYSFFTWSLIVSPIATINKLSGPIFVAIAFGYIAGLGITAGAHRLWSHKSYKAKLPLRIFLMIAQCMAGQNCLYIWCREHRVHHKFSETDADPHSTKRGFFFAHVGWLLRKKHPEVMINSAKLDFSDLLADPVVKFQMKWYNELYLIFALALPVLLPYALFDITLMESFSMYLMRYMASLHSTWFVNSTAHMFGDQPYSKKQQARENSWVSYGALGEGYHNYHHSFPFDYRTAEDGMKFNFTKKFIDLMAATGQAYDLKTVKEETVQATKEKVLMGLEE